MRGHGDLWWPTHAELSAQAGVDELWQAYCTTWVRISLPEGSVQIRPSALPRDASPPAGELHVITACDPASCGDRRDDDKRLALLRRTLRCHVCFPAEGSDPGGEHTEPSLAVSGLSDRDAQELGALFGQVTVFSWRGPHWSVLAYTAGRCSDLCWEMSEF